MANKWQADAKTLLVAITHLMDQIDEITDGGLYFGTHYSKEGDSHCLKSDDVKGIPAYRIDYDPIRECWAVYKRDGSLVLPSLTEQTNG